MVRPHAGMYEFALRMEVVQSEKQSRYASLQERLGKPVRQMAVEYILEAVPHGLLDKAFVITTLSRLITSRAVLTCLRPGWEVFPALSDLYILNSPGSTPSLVNILGRV